MDPARHQIKKIEKRQRSLVLNHPLGNALAVARPECPADVFPIVRRRKAGQTVNPPAFPQPETHLHMVKVAGGRIAAIHDMTRREIPLLTLCPPIQPIRFAFQRRLQSANMLYIIASILLLNNGWKCLGDFRSSGDSAKAAEVGAWGLCEDQPERDKEPSDKTFTATCRPLLPCRLRMWPRIPIWVENMLAKRTRT